MGGAQMKSERLSSEENLSLAKSDSAGVGAKQLRDAVLPTYGAVDDHFSLPAEHAVIAAPPVVES